MHPIEHASVETVDGCATRGGGERPLLVATSSESVVSPGRFARLIEFLFGRDPSSPPPVPGDAALAVFRHEIRVTRRDGSVESPASTGVGSVHAGFDRWGRDTVVVSMVGGSRWARLVLPSVGSADGPASFLVGRAILRGSAFRGARLLDPHPLLSLDGMLKTA